MTFLMYFPKKLVGQANVYIATGQQSCDRRVRYDGRYRVRLRLRQGCDAQRVALGRIPYTNTFSTQQQWYTGQGRYLMFPSYPQISAYNNFIKPSPTCTRPYTRQTLVCLLHVTASHGCHHQGFHSVSKLVSSK